MRAPLFHRRHRVPQARTLALPERLARLDLHADCFLGRRYLRRSFGARKPLQQRADAVRIAMNLETQAWAHARYDIDPLDDNVGSTIAAHPVNGKNQAVGHIFLFS